MFPRCTAYKESLKAFNEMTDRICEIQTTTHSPSKKKIEYLNAKITLHTLLFLDSEELDRRTKETQRLQEEVENATREALEKFCCTYGISSSPEQSCHDHSKYKQCHPTWYLYNNSQE